MKNQYFGDINDYRKYGLLRMLSNERDMRLAVCWMLTTADDRGHGSLTDYIQDPGQWRAYDPALFDFLALSLTNPDNRHVGWMESSDLLPSAIFYPRLLTDRAEQREEYFRRFLCIAHGCELVFLDPDNGLEVKSKPYGRKDSCKYLYWSELSDTFEAGHSVLVYQHFRREKRDPFVARLIDRVRDETGASEIICFRTARVVFLLIPQRHHLHHFQERSKEVARTWSSQIEVVLYPSPKVSRP